MRYMVPAAPLLFFALLPVLQRIGQQRALFVAMFTLAISWSVAMVRLDVPTSLAHVFLSTRTAAFRRPEHESGR